MKQTVEEAAKVAADAIYPMARNSWGYEKIVEGFKAGAEWQAKQSPWISVEERLPENGENVLFYSQVGGAIVGCYEKEMVDELEITHWMPIPSFDHILEANKDVLKRLKDK